MAVAKLLILTVRPRIVQILIVNVPIAKNLKLLIVQLMIVQLLTVKVLIVRLLIKVTKRLKWFNKLLMMLKLLFMSFRVNAINRAKITALVAIINAKK